uniref:Elongator complex protein 4 n=1 Tax=Timema cristinae TaxID=61476 RepID=A0A7R9D9R7_TIMCR|nr:unnamed protein product [Timema cristinae]
MASQVISFQKKVKSKVPSLPGSKLSIHNAQLLISSGVPSLDYIIGGGLAVGTITLIEEDTFGNYAKLLLKYFLAEGVMCRHSLLVASQDSDPEKMVSELPAPVQSELSSGHSGANTQEDKMMIAWRYQNMRTVQSSPTGSHFGHYYDLTKSMPQDVLDQLDISYWNSSHQTDAAGFCNPAYTDLLTAIQHKISLGQFQVSDTPEKRNILRVAIHSLGSPLWRANQQRSDLTLFLYCLRSLLRSSLAVCVVTVPSHLFQARYSFVFTWGRQPFFFSLTAHPLSPGSQFTGILPFQDPCTIKRCEHLCDVSVRLESFAGSDRETNPVLKDYHGFFHINKLPAINTLASHVPESLDLAFKLRRKKFLIEKLHLPPELQESTEREQDDILTTPSSGSCGGGGRRNLDF